MTNTAVSLEEYSLKLRLDKLPQNVLRNIALNLDISSLLRLTETSRTLCNSLSADSTIWTTISRRHFAISDHLPSSRIAFLMQYKMKRRKPKIDPLMNQAVEDSDDTSFSLPTFGSQPHLSRSTCPPSSTMSKATSYQTKPSESKPRKSMFDDTENMEDWFSRKLDNPMNVRDRKKNSRSSISMNVAPAVALASMPFCTALASASMRNTSTSTQSHARAQSMIFNVDNRPRIGSDVGKARRVAFDDQNKKNESEQLQTFLKKREYVPDSYRFDTLLARPEYRGLKMGIERFMGRFESVSQGSVNKEKTLVHGLLREIEQEMHKLPVWKTLPPNHFALAKEDMQRSIYTKLYPVIYIKREYQQRDAETLAHIAKVRSVLKPIYLNLADNLVENPSVFTAMKELHKIDSLRSPMDKVNCVMNASRIVSFVLSSGSGAAAASDDFLPLFIYVVMRTELRGPCSTIEFVERYIDPEERYGEAYCFFTHFIGAITYLKNQQPDVVAREVEKMTIAKKKAEIEKMPSLFEESFEQLHESAATMSKSLEDNISPVVPRTESLKPEGIVQRSVSTPSDSSLSSASVVTAGADPLHATVDGSGPQSTTRSRAAARATTDKPVVDIDNANPSQSQDSLPPPEFEIPDKDSDGEFLSQLHFLQSMEIPTNDEDIALLISEYKKLAEIAKNYLPVVTKSKTWRKESAVRSFVMEIPGDARVTCLIVAYGYVWAGMNNGNVCVCRPQRGDICAQIPVHHSPVARLLQVGNVIWCVSSAGAVLCLDPTFLNVTGKGFNVHDKKHNNVVDVVYDSATGYAWSLGILDPLRSTRKVKLETQLTRIQVSSGVQKSFVVPGSAVSASLFRGTLWVAFEDGKIVPYNTTSGMSTGAIGPFTQPNSHSHIIMTSPNQQQMWFSTGDTLQMIKGSIGIDMMPVMTTGLSGRIVALAPSSIVWNRVPTREGAGSTSSLSEDHEDCEVVVSVDAVGTICVWNTFDRTCEVSIATSLQEPLCLSCSSGTEQGQSWWVAAQQNMLYCWLYA